MVRVHPSFLDSQWLPGNERNMPLKDLWAEIAGRVDGTCKGKGGPMHVTYPDKGIMVTTGIVALFLLLLFFLTGIELAFAMAVMGFLGFAYLVNFSAASNLLRLLNLAEPVQTMLIVERP